MCTPSVNIDGTIVAGEADTCHHLGTVSSTVADIEEALCTMTCNKCGLGKLLSPMHLEAIGGKV
jgi:hypothetical protein